MTLSGHCLALWLCFFLVFTVLISMNVFSKSPIGSWVGSSILMLIIGATTITVWPRGFESGLLISFEIFLFLVFLLYLFSLYLMCCSGRVSSNAASGNMLGVWVILFVCYCMMVAEVMTSRRNLVGGANVMLMFGMYLLYVSFQMLLLAACDLQSEVISCYHQMKLMLVAILCGWILDLDTLSALCCGTKSKWYQDGNYRQREELMEVTQLNLGYPSRVAVQSTSDIGSTLR